MILLPFSKDPFGSFCVMAFTPTIRSAIQVGILAAVVLFGLPSSKAFGGCEDHTELGGAEARARQLWHHQTHLSVSVPQKPCKGPHCSLKRSVPASPAPSVPHSAPAQDCLELVRWDSLFSPFTVWMFPLPRGEAPRSGYPLSVFHPPCA